MQWRGQGAIPPQQWPPAPQWRPGMPQWRPGMPMVPPPVSAPGQGWWTASAVLAFIGAGSAVATLGGIMVLVGFLGLFVAAQGGEEGLHQISADFLQTTSWLFYLFLALQIASTVVGLWAGRNCLRGKASGALMAMLLGVVAVGEAIWLGLTFATPSRMVMGIAAGLALIVCPAIALRFPQPRRR